METPGDNFFFFLGGHDLEMLTISELLLAHVPDYFNDKGLSWGAKASDYRSEIECALQSGKTPVLVELTDDLHLAEKVLVVDHHGPLAGTDKPTSLHQVFSLLGLPKNLWTRHLELVAANDRGHINGMLETGATREEIIAIRAADRTAQGITEEEEQQAKAALNGLRRLSGEKLTIVDLPHTRTAVIADRLAPELGGPGYENLLVISPEEVNFFGAGNIIRKLDKEYPGGWYGGSLPERGFWGHDGTIQGIEQFIKKGLNCSD